MLMLLLGYRHVSAPLVKLQKTLKESLEQPWLGSIQYSPAEGDTEAKKVKKINKKSKRQFLLGKWGSAFRSKGFYLVSSFNHRCVLGRA